MNSFSLRLKS